MRLAIVRGAAKTIDCVFKHVSTLDNSGQWIADDKVLPQLRIAFTDVDTTAPRFTWRAATMVWRFGTAPILFINHIEDYRFMAQKIRIGGDEDGALVAWAWKDPARMQSGVSNYLLLTALGAARQYVGPCKLR